MRDDASPLDGRMTSAPCLLARARGVGGRRLGAGAEWSDGRVVAQEHGPSTNDKTEGVVKRRASGGKLACPSAPLDRRHPPRS